MDEKLEKILREMKNSRRTQSVPNRRYREQNTPRAGTSKYASNEDGEENASEPKIKNVKYRIILPGHLI